MNLNSAFALITVLASTFTPQAFAAQDCSEERGKIVVPIRRNYVCQSGDIYWHSPNAQTEEGRNGFPDSEWKKNVESGILYHGTVRPNGEFTFMLSSGCLKTPSGSISGGLEGLSAALVSTATFSGENLAGLSHPVIGVRVNGTLKDPTNQQSTNFVFEEGYISNVEVHSDAILTGGYYRITLGNERTIYLVCSQNR